MAINIKNEEADRLAHELAQKTGESLTETVIKALRERLIRQEGRKSVMTMDEDLMEIGKRCAALPELDSRTSDEILGYNKIGVPE